jgi:hypothetical protein
MAERLNEWSPGRPRRKQDGDFEVVLREIGSEGGRWIQDCVQRRSVVFSVFILRIYIPMLDAFK